MPEPTGRFTESQKFTASSFHPRVLLFSPATSVARPCKTRLRDLGRNPRGPSAQGCAAQSAVTDVLWGTDSRGNLVLLLAHGSLSWHDVCLCVISSTLKDVSTAVGISALCR